VSHKPKNAKLYLHQYLVCEARNSGEDFGYHNLRSFSQNSQEQD